jgi:hypothetical protein
MLDTADRALVPKVTAAAVPHLPWFFVAGVARSELYTQQLFLR